jgi:hypothetical protein
LTFRKRCAAVVTQLQHVGAGLEQRSHALELALLCELTGPLTYQSAPSAAAHALQCGRCAGHPRLLQSASQNRATLHLTHVRSLRCAHDCAPHAAQHADAISRRLASSASAPREPGTRANAMAAERPWFSCAKVRDMRRAIRGSQHHRGGGARTGAPRSLPRLCSTV